MKKKIISLGFILALAIYLLSPILANAEEKKEMTIEDYISLGGYIEPETWGSSYGTLSTFSLDGYSMDGASTLPTKYDTRDNYNIPEIRDQGSYGTCWAHATVACMEINLIKKGLSTNSINLSELQLAYYANYSVNDPLGNTQGESYSFDSSSYCFLCRGGNSLMSVQPMSRGLQLTDENKTKDLAYSKCDDYHPSNPGSSGLHAINKLKSGMSSINPAAKVVGYAEFSTDDLNGVKKAIKEYGAVQASYFADSSYYSSDSTGIFVSDSNLGTNHAITLVGWDDNYSKDKLKNRAGKTPKSNGAFIMRNSWGKINSIGGYFYISYEDKSLSRFCIYDTELATSKNNAYFYNNYNILKDSFYTIASDAFSNVYTASGANYKGEKLYAVSAWICGEKGDSLTCKIYSNLTDKNKPESGTLVASTKLKVNTSGSLVYAYSALESPVYLASGSSFAIVIEGSDDSAVVAVPYAKTGQSFAKINDSYCDMSNYYSNISFNFEIMAYTQGVYADSHTITYVLNGGKNSSKNPSKYYEGSGVASFANPTKSGYEFKGWYLDSAFKTKVTSISKSEKKDIKLYAKWQKKAPYTKTYTVSKSTYLVNYSATDAITKVTLVKFADTSKTSVTVDKVKINGKSVSVTAIGANAFKSNRKVTKVTIGSSVNSIGEKAFYGCSKLKSLVINTKSLTTKNVGSKAFTGIHSSAKVQVPASVYTKCKSLLKSRGITGAKQSIVKK